MRATRTGRRLNRPGGPTRKVFVASSKESKGVAQGIADALEAVGIIAEAWWRAFRPGEYFLEELFRLSRTVDGAVFVMGADDQVWYRGKKYGAPRDNVLLEYGLFAARIGRAACYVVRDEKVRLPSDLEGIHFPARGRRTSDIALKVAEHFQGEFAAPEIAAPPVALNIVEDPALASDLTQESLPKQWLMRAMYVGTEGARAWLSIYGDEQYESEREREAVLRRIKELLGGDHAYQTFVSLGPGDGELDQMLATYLQGWAGAVRYIPVDISHALLGMSYRKLAQRVRVPVGVLADFEGGWDFVKGQVAAHARGPLLYGLLGNTFGNLDRSEASFIGGVHNHLKKGDAVLMDVAVVKPAKRDARPDLSPGLKRFLAHGAARFVRQPEAEIVRRFDNLVSWRIEEGKSEVPGARTLIFCAGPDGEGRQRQFAKIRRFEKAPLLDWLTNVGFTIELRDIPMDGPIDTCILKLRRKR